MGVGNCLLICTYLTVRLLNGGISFVFRPSNSFVYMASD